jgi:hypothetical protein
LKINDVPVTILFAVLVALVTTSAIAEKLTIKKIDSRWQQKFKAGTLNTPYKHYMALLKGECLESSDNCSLKHQYFTARLWALDKESAGRGVRALSNNLGFVASAKIEVLPSKRAKQPPPDKNSVDIYDWQFAKASDCVKWQCRLANVPVALL